MIGFNFDITKRPLSFNLRKFMMMAGVFHLASSFGNCLGFFMVTHIIAANPLLNNNVNNSAMLLVTTPYSSLNHISTNSSTLDTGATVSVYLFQVYAIYIVTTFINFLICSKISIKFSWIRKCAIFKMFKEKEHNIYFTIIHFCVSFATILESIIMILVFKYVYYIIPPISSDIFLFDRNVIYSGSITVFIIEIVTSVVSGVFCISAICIPAPYPVYTSRNSNRSLDSKITSDITYVENEKIVPMRINLEIDEGIKELPDIPENLRSRMHLATRADSQYRRKLEQIIGNTHQKLECGAVLKMASTDGELCPMEEEERIPTYQSFIKGTDYQNNSKVEASKELKSDRRYSTLLK